MAPGLFDAGYLVVGFFMANGIPHFVFGMAGKSFRSPFGRKSLPKVNVSWGLANFLVATLVSAALAYYRFYDGFSLAFLMVGFWLIVLMFGARIRSFINE